LICRGSQRTRDWLDEIARLGQRDITVAASSLFPVHAPLAEQLLDFVVAEDSIGDPQGIVSGTTRATTDPVGLQIAQTAARIIEASGLLTEGFSFQTGAGGISLAVAAALKDVMHVPRRDGDRRGPCGGMKQMSDDSRCARAGRNPQVEQAGEAESWANWTER
jgi:citrate lyase alpha subunit